MTNSDKVNKYQNGKIYSIRSYQTDKYYIGSTCSPLHKRLYQHKQEMKGYNKYKENPEKYPRYGNITSYEIVKFDDCYIELIEFFPCKSVYELQKREGELIRNNKDQLVNKEIPKGEINPYYKRCDYVICNCGSKVQMCSYLKHCVRCGSKPKEYSSLKEVYDEEKENLKKEIGISGNATFE